MAKPTPAAAISNATPDIDSLIDDNIFTMLGMDSIAEDRKAKILDDMMRTVENRIIARVLDLLDEEGIKGFNDAIDKGDDKVKPYLQSKGINFIDVAASEVLLYKAEIVSMLGGSRPAALAL